MNKNRGMDMEEQPKKDKVYTTTWWNIIQIIILLAWVCSVFLKIRSDINQARTIDKAIERIEREASERESYATVEKLEVILKLLTFKHNPKPCSLPGLRREETITATHAVDAF